ncbi:MAG TPA: hypothetical protein VN811_16955 [Thermoanaerobaculia bacterium]|nr:hypothetical protein [Thermoanaerobaculia bacterium]
MTPELTTAAVSAAGVILAAVLAAVAGYVFTKRKEREAEWRKEKLERYKAFVASLSGVLQGPNNTEEGLREFSASSNNLLLFAPQPVIEALILYREETRTSNPSPSREQHDLLLNCLFYEIRRDLALRPRDRRADFRVQLWATGPSDPVNTREQPKRG